MNYTLGLRCFKFQTGDLDMCVTLHATFSMHSLQFFICFCDSLPDVKGFSNNVILFAYILTIHFIVKGASWIYKSPCSKRTETTNSLLISFFMSTLKINNLPCCNQTVDKRVKLKKTAPLLNCCIVVSFWLIAVWNQYFLFHD